MSFLKKSKHGTFRFFFYFWASNDQLALLPKIKNCRYLCSFYHKSAFDLVHQYWLVHLNKYQLVNVNTIKTCSKTFDMCKSKIWQYACKRNINSLEVIWFIFLLLTFKYLVRSPFSVRKLYFTCCGTVFFTFSYKSNFIRKLTFKYGFAKL